MKICSNCKHEILEGLPFCPHCGKQQKLVENDNTFASEDPYKIFQVSRDASLDVIEAVYRSLAKKHHPDNNVNENDENIKKINWAYSILHDEEKRGKWDAEHPNNKDDRKVNSEKSVNLNSNESPLKTGKNRKLITIITGFCLIIFYLIITLLDYHREYNKMASFYATSNAKVISQQNKLNQKNNEITKLNSTIMTKSSTQVAQQTTIIAQKSFLDSLGQPHYLDSGKILHRPDDEFIELNCIGEYQDFIVEVEFINPYYATAYTGWDYGILFRDVGENNELRLVLSSDARWSLHEGVSDEIKSGYISNFITNNNGQNKLKLIVADDLVSIYVNGAFINSVYISKDNKKGKVCLGTGFYTGDELQGEYTEFKDLQVFPITILQ
jgi:hypothetical protein